MSEVPDFTRLARNWRFWSAAGQLGDIAVSTDCDDCAVLFSSTTYSVHLHTDGLWWSVDTIDDRGQRQNDTARFSTFALAEKYLVWTWASLARSFVGATILGRRFYDAGFAPGVAKELVAPGTFELRVPTGRAVLMEPYGTIFSHLIAMSEEQIEKMVLADMGGTAPI